MGSTLRTAEAVVLVVVLAALLWLLFSWWRRIRISGGQYTALCRVRAAGTTRSAIVRLGPRAVEFHSLWGAGTRPFAALRRTTVEIQWLDEQTPVAGSRWVRLTGEAAPHGRRLAPGEEIDVVLSPGAGRALRAWQETLPPGHSFSTDL